MVVKTESDSVVAKTIVPSTINIEPLEAMEYECPDGEILNTKRVDVNNLGNISFSDMATLINDPSLYVQSNNIIVDTVNYRFGDCFTQSFASYPYFTVEFESENYRTIKILTYALDAKKMGLEPLDSLSNTLDPDSGGFFDYNYNLCSNTSIILFPVFIIFNSFLWICNFTRCGCNINSFSK